jgi:hypothetical protein
MPVTSRAWRIVLVSVLVMGLGNLIATYLYVRSNNASQNASQDASQKRQGAISAARLCSSLNRLAVLKAPEGDPATNPGRAYDQELNAILITLGPDAGCPKAPASSPAG